LFDNDIVVSPQVINEFIAVTLRKNILTPARTVDYARQFIDVFHITVTTSETIVAALDIMTSYRFSYWDSLILSAALESSCTILYTEDMQHDQLIENQLTICNPFR